MILRSDSGKDWDVPDVFVRKLLPIIKEVAEGRLAVMEDREMEGDTVDVGGRGIPYRTIRVRHQGDVYILNQSAIEKCLGEIPQTVPADIAVTHTEPQNNPAARVSGETHPAQAPSKTAEPDKRRPETHLGTQEFEKIFSELIELIRANHEWVNESDMAAFNRWLEINRKKDLFPLVELALVQALKSKTMLPLIRIRLIQYVSQHATPRVVKAVQSAAKDALLKKYLKDPRIRSAVQNLAAGLTELGAVPINCSNCGAEQTEDADFCDQCGMRIKRGR